MDIVGGAVAELVGTGGVDRARDVQVTRPRDPRGRGAEEDQRVSVEKVVSCGMAGHKTAVAMAYNSGLSQWWVPGRRAVRLPAARR